MDTAEIVIRKMQIHSSPKILQFPRERIGQTCEAAKLHSDRQVLPLDIAGGDVIGIGVTAADFGYNLRDLSWGVALISVLAIVSVELRKLCEVRISRERFFDGLAVEDVGISGQLDAMVSDPTPEVAHEGLGVIAGSFADQERRNELRIRVHGDENPLIAEVSRIVLADVPRLLHQESPDFVALDTAARQLSHLAIHQFLGAFASQDKQAHDGVPVESCEPLRGTNRAAFKKALQRPCCRVGVRSHRVPREFVVGFAEGRFAGCAAPALNAALTEVTKFLADLVLALYARHGFSPLDFCGRKPHTHFGSGVRLTPRFGLAPPPVQAGSGALNVSDVLGWGLNRDNYGLTVSKANLNPESHADSILPESPVDAGLSHFTPKSSLAAQSVSHRGVCRFVGIFASEIGQGGDELITRFVVGSCASLFDLALAHETINDRVHRCHHVAILRDVVAHHLQLPFDLCRCQSSCGSSSTKCGTNCVSESNRIFLYKLFIQHSRHRRDHRAESRDLLFENFLLFEKLSQLVLSREQVIFRFVQQYLVIKFRHGGIKT